MNKEIFYPTYNDEDPFKPSPNGAHIREEIKLSIDPTLNFQHIYSPASLFVAKVILEGFGEETKYAILKLAIYKDPQEKHMQRMAQVEKEKQIFPLLKNFTEIPKLIRVYQTYEYCALLKEYLSGENPSVRYIRGSDRKYVLTKNQKKKLEDLVSRLHKEGIACLDLSRGGNILISKDGEPHLFDFGSAILKDLHKRKKFTELKEKDFWNLNFFSIIDE